MDTGDTTWILIATALVLFMHVPGLALFYGGLVSERNVVSTMMHSFVSLLIVSIVWVLWGYTLSYGTDLGGGLIGGLDYLGLRGVGGEAALGSLTIPHYLFAMLQIVYAAITVAIISGGIAGRISFKAWVVFAAVWPTLIYAPMAHWVWGGGWLFQMGELDFAGGTVVHILSGVAALVAALMIGPRRGYLEEKHRPHNIVLFLFGAATLWFGWFGFNGGSALASGSITSLAVINTHTAGAAAGIGWLIMEWTLRKRPTLIGTATGAIAGLVAITPGAGFVTVPSALIIGLLAAPVCYFSIHFLKARLKYDDTLDAFGVHGMAGIWGALATGLFATKSVNPAGNDGLFYGNPEQLLHQFAGVGTAVLLSGVGTFIILKVMGMFMQLRVSEEEEMMGLDLSFHEEPAYNTENQEKVEEHKNISGM
ncbi:ammonium transporter [Domibacillus sp. A3M-37]|uniref:ammonium transporter n=1 Tax=Domibacillus TaxID=1433999 RepID=UPI0020B788E1|nr:ammonium transporter [Domibacillus sp. A3M-37]MCP3763834.1 ammonium transporter [Domibacillus sp. A3M-37]